MAITISAVPDSIMFTRNLIAITIASSSGTTVSIELVVTVNAITSSYYLSAPVIGGDVTFYLNKILNDCLNPALDFPLSQSDSAPVLCANTTLSYYMNITEFTSGAITDTETSSVYTAVAGGIEEQYAAGNIFWTTSPALIPFQTWHNLSRKKQITPSDAQYLTFFTRAPADPVNHRLKSYGFDDATIQTVKITDVEVEDTVGLNMYRIAFNNPTISFADFLTDITVVKKIEVWLEQEPTPYTEKRTYYIDHQTYLHNNQFAYLNPMGGADTINLHGPLEIAPNILRFIAAKSKPANYQANDAPLFNYNISSSREFKISNTAASRYEALYIEELLLSPKVCFLSEGYWIPVIITSSKVKLIDDSQQIYAYEIEYRLAHNNTSFTPARLIE